MVSHTQWTWVWANSGRQWRTGELGVLQSMGLQSWTRLSDWVTTSIICFPLSDLHHSVWQTLGPSTSLQMIQYRSFLWLQFSMSTISTERPCQTISPKITETSLHFVFNFPERLNKKKGNECNDFPSRLYFRTQTLRNSPQGSTWVRTSFFFFFSILLTLSSIFTKWEEKCGFHTCQFYYGQHSLQP